jgi:hypothetical protein
MKYFIGAKDLEGRVIVAEMIDADSFMGAWNQARDRAEKQVGVGNFRVTAVNEQLWENGRPAVAEFLEGERS